jgi:pimeloyl-ACP methyl ester carboxylesterase
MAFVAYEGKQIYYEVHGSGTPLVVLNGIMMSHASWKAFIPELSRGCQVVLLDFFDQGKSDKMDGGYKQDLQVEAVKAVLDELKLGQVNLFGISYGGEVAIQFALKYQERVGKLLLFNTAAWTSPWLHDIGRGWVDAANTRSSGMFYNITIPIVYSPAFYTKNINWMNERKKLLAGVFTPEFLDAMIRLIESAEGYDARNNLKEINVETMVVSSDNDFITPAAEQLLIHEQIKSSSYVMIRDCGHASMYEKPNEFISILKGFLEIGQRISII